MCDSRHFTVRGVSSCASGAFIAVYNVVGVSYGNNDRQAYRSF